MNRLASLKERHGKNPLGFFWVLEPDGGNPHLEFAKQSQIWSATLAEEAWFAPFASRAMLVLISDNGDLVFDLAGETLLCNPRSGDFEVHPFSIEKFLTRARLLKSNILPPDL